MRFGLLSVLGGRKRLALMAARQLFDTAVAAARRPELYLTAEVPDTVEGRFEMVALHVALTQVPLEATEQGQTVASALWALMMDDFDASLRELGVSDARIAKRVRVLAEGFEGRKLAYHAALAGAAAKPEVLDIVTRNVFDLPEVAAIPHDGHGAYMLTNYILAAASHLRALDPQAVAKGEVSFPGDPAIFDNEPNP